MDHPDRRSASGLQTPDLMLVRRRAGVARYRIGGVDDRRVAKHGAGFRVLKSPSNFAAGGGRRCDPSVHMDRGAGCFTYGICTLKTVPFWLPAVALSNR